MKDKGSTTLTNQALQCSQCLLIKFSTLIVFVWELVTVQSLIGWIQYAEQKLAVAEDQAV